MNKKSSLEQSQLQRQQSWVLLQTAKHSLISPLNELNRDCSLEPFCNWADRAFRLLWIFSIGTADSVHFSCCWKYWENELVAGLVMGMGDHCKWVWAQTRSRRWLNSNQWTAEAFSSPSPINDFFSNFSLPPPFAAVDSSTCTFL